MKAIGIILAGGNNNRMKELTAKRAVPALPVAGSFRSIDFALSSMSNSHIQTVAVLTQYNARSLNEHLSSSKWWNFGRKQGGLFLFTPTVTADNSDWYRGTADAMYQNIDFLKRRHEPYVIISSGDCVYKLDFNRVLDFHIEKKSDITVVCKDMMYNDDVSRFGVVRMDDESRITEFDEKPIEASSNTTMSERSRASRSRSPKYRCTVPGVWLRMLSRLATMSGAAPVAVKARAPAAKASPKRCAALPVGAQHTIRGAR